MNILDTFDFIDDMDLDDLEFMDNYRDVIHRERVNPFEHYSEQDLKKRYRFTKGFANKIVDLVKDELSTDARGGALGPQLQVACALRCWARHQIQDNTADLYGISQQVASKTCKNVAEALAKKANLFIKMPTTIDEQLNTMRDFRSISGFPSVIGAIDCTHIKIKRVGGDLSEAYVNRKGYFSINVQVVCDAHLKIRDVVAQWRGCTHDSRIFNESSIKERFERGEFHGRLLGDSGYVCTTHLFTPVLNPQDQKEEAYNRAHIRTRNTVERCFGLWKQRFRCLLRGMFTKLSTAKTTVVALAVLHKQNININIAIDMNESTEIVPYIYQPARYQNVPDTQRGNIVRRNFIQNNF